MPLQVVELIVEVVEEGAVKVVINAVVLVTLPVTVAQRSHVSNVRDRDIMPVTARPQSLLGKTGIWSTATNATRKDILDETALMM